MGIVYPITGIVKVVLIEYDVSHILFRLAIEMLDSLL